MVQGSLKENDLMSVLSLPSRQTLMLLSRIFPAAVWRTEPSRSRVPLRVLEGVVRDDHARLLRQAFPVPEARTPGGEVGGHNVSTYRRGFRSEMGELTKERVRNARFYRPQLAASSLWTDW